MKNTTRGRRRMRRQRRRSYCRLLRAGLKTGPKRFMVRRAVTLFVVNLCVFVAAAELIALAVFGFQTGWLYYVDPYVPQIERVAEPPAGRLTTVALHPYFGPTHQPGIPFDLPAELRPERAAPAAAA